MNDNAVKKGKSVSQIARNNKVVVIAHCVEGFVLPIAYLLEYFKGARTLAYILIFSIIALAPVIMELIVYFNNKESKAVKHLVGYGYALTYAFALLTTNNNLAFTYAIPMIIAITVYNDFLYCAKLNVGCFLVNVAQVIFFLASGKFVVRGLGCY